LTDKYFTQRNLVVIYRRFGGSCCFYLHCSLQSRSWTHHITKKRQ